MNHPIFITVADPRSAPAIASLKAYYAELAHRFEQGFDVTLSRDPDATAMVPPVGTFLLALWGDRPVGCVGLKGPGPIAEIKRLWVDPNTRGTGLAKRLMQATEDQARALGITTLRLDTNKALPEAAALYRKTGWSEIPRFNDDPYAELFFEKHLSQASDGA